MTNYLQKYLIDLNDLTNIERISSGGFGLVCLVQDKKTHQVYAAKIIHSSETEQNKVMINREIGIMIRMQHPTIIKFYGYSLTDFEGKNHVTLLLQYAKNGSLASYLKKVQNGLADHNYDNTTRQKILIGIARAMMFLHKHNVIHRDLKPDNVLLDDNLEPHVTDFGTSKFYSSGQSNNQTQNVGTAIYMAPEIIEGVKYNGKADVYSFAILMYEVVTDLVPYEDFQKGNITLFQFNMKVLSENYRPEFKVPIKKSIKELIEKCWSSDPNERPTFDEIFNRLAFNIEESVYDVFENDDDTPKYYLDDVDQNEILFYVDDIIGEMINEKSGSVNQAEFDKLKETVASLQEKNKSMSDEIIQLKAQLTDLSKLKTQSTENKEPKIQSNTMKEPKIQSTKIDKSKAQLPEVEPPKIQSNNDKSKAKIIKLLYAPNKEFKGIFNYIKSLGNFARKVNITSSSIARNDLQFSPTNVVNYDSNKYFMSSDLDSSWICFDFKDYRIIPTDYTILSYENPSDQHPNSWVIEGYNDTDDSWKIIDEENNCNLLNGGSKVHTFRIRKQSKQEFRMIRMRQTAKNCLDNNCLLISSFELYGTLIQY